MAIRFGLDHAYGWSISAALACREYGPQSADVVMVSGGPFTSFMPARQCAKRIGCPLVLDYRDMWTANPYRNVRNSFQCRAEAAALIGADGVITVAPTGLRLLERYFRLPVHRMVLTNGYDEDVLKTVSPSRFAEKAVVYCGQLYCPKSVLTPVFEALSLMDDSVGHWKFHYYGSQGNLVADQAAVFSLADRVVDHGAVPHRESLAAVAGADLTVVVTSVDPEGTEEDRAIVTGKVYEPLGLGVPILGVAPIGSDLEVVVGDSGRVFPGNQIDAIRGYIADVIAQPRVAKAPRREYAWSALGARLDGFLQSVAAETTAGTR